MTKTEEWHASQLSLRQSLVLPCEPIPLSTLSTIATITLPSGTIYAGCDLTEPVHADMPSVASYACVDATNTVVFEQHKVVTITNEYIPSFLSFRESPCILPLIQNTIATRPELTPTYLLTDGNGLLHPSSFGLACHVGVKLNRPVIGVSKSLHVYEGLCLKDGTLVTAKGIKEVFKRPIQGKSTEIIVLDNLPSTAPPLTPSFTPSPPPPPSRVLFLYHAATIVGAAYVKGGGLSSVPIYISVGNHVNLTTAIQVVDQLSVHRVPSPVR